MVELRLPNIKGATEREQLIEIKGYLYQLAEQLQFALNNINTSSAQVVTNIPRVSSPISTASTGQSTQATFNSIKSLIIKSAEIVDAYYDEINRRLEGVYVAQSDFGDFAEKTSQEIEETSTSTIQRFENIQVLISNQGSELESVSGELASVSGEIASVSGEVASVKSDLQIIGTDLSYAQQSLVTIGSEIEAIDSYVATVEGEVNALDTSLQTTKTELQSKVETAKSELAGSINSTKSELSGSINTAKETLSSDINSAKEELSGNINSVKTNLEGSIDSAKEELTGSIDNVKNNLEGSIDNAVANANALADAAEEAARGYTDDTASALAGQIGETASDLEGKILDANSRIDDTNGAIEDLGSGLEDANKRLDSTEGALEATKTDLSASIQRVADSVSSTDKLLADAKAQLQGGIDDLEFILTGLKQIVIGVTAYIKSGLLYYTDAGVPVYGIEIGQEVESNGEKVFNKFSRFTSEKLSFYDPNGIEVAYISDKKLYIKQAEITISLKIGGIINLVMSNGDVVKKWAGG